MRIIDLVLVLCLVGLVVLALLFLVLLPKAPPDPPEVASAFKPEDIMLYDDTGPVVAHAPVRMRRATKPIILATELPPFSPLEEFGSIDLCQAQIKRLDEGGKRHGLPPGDYMCMPTLELSQLRASYLNGIVKGRFK